MSREPVITRKSENGVPDGVKSRGLKLFNLVNLPNTRHLLGATEQKLLIDTGQGW